MTEERDKYKLSMDIFILIVKKTYFSLIFFTNLNLILCFLFSVGIIKSLLLMAL
jgi:hypothetical protein